MNTTSKIILCAAMGSAAALLCVETWAQRIDAPERSGRASTDFELRIDADKSEYAVGEQPRFTATLTNNSNDAVMLARPLDGSDFGRFPQLMWTVTAPEDAKALEPLGRCGNTNPITTGAFFSLPAGESVVLSGAWSGVAPHELNRGPGRYAIQLMYSTDSEDARGWIGGPMVDRDARQLERKIAPLLAQVPRITVKSNVLEIQFHDPKRVKAEEKSIATF